MKKVLVFGLGKVGQLVGNMLHETGFEVTGVDSAEKNFPFSTKSIDVTNEKEVSSFVLPIGATINMDGTSLYQAVAAVFIAQAFGMDLDFGTQLGIIATATLASIGSAAVPGAGMVMLVIVLAQAGIPEAGLALIFAIDRPLDMCRTTVNVTGDASVSMLVAKSVGKLREVPLVKNWNDNYKK